MTNYTLVDHPEQLPAALDALRDSPWLAVDTEFVRENTYRANLCLIQLGNPDTALCVDVTALDPAPLFAFLAEEQRTKVFHSPDQDLELFVQHTGDCLRPLFDTQIAAALLGHGEQLGYAALVERRLGEKVDKSLSRTNWAKRPLPPAALAYAADDVRHLSALYPALREEVARRGRLAWLEEECGRMTEADRYLPKPEQAWRSLKGLGRLDGPAQRRAARLAAWREEEALQRNRPRRWILEDDAITRLAANPPATPEQMKGVERVPEKFVARNGAAIIALLNEPLASQEPLVSGERPGPELRKRIQVLKDELAAIAEREQIAQTLIATRSDIEALARDGAAAKVLLLEGWRREVAGEKLLGML